MKTCAALAFLAGIVSAEVLWDGRFNDIKSAAALEEWSFSNPVGPYQYYIHGKGNVDEYVALGASFANPADTSSSKGAKISLTDTAYWNGQTMRRTELIPQTTAKIAAGKVFYHFSIKKAAENAPSTAREHQIAFFESHFTELKSGGSEGEKLSWFAGGESKWDAVWEADVWHNVAYEIDFSGETVGLWHSTGADDLKQVVKPITASTSSNGADWHVGVLELSNGDADKNEDFFFSGVYIEDGEITTSISGGKSSGGGDSTTPEPAVSKPATPAPTTKEPVVEPPAATKEPVAEAPASTKEPVVEAPSATKEPVVEAPSAVKPAPTVDATTLISSTIPATTAPPAVEEPAEPAPTTVITKEPVNEAPAVTVSAPAATTTRISRCKRSRRRVRRSL